ncbi:MAG: aconitate hydratase, partial [Kiritimatiellae bacterium]|nr:aconitate hydratase [Kiritimatiellia bacterium]
AKSIERIHRANLINFGIVPLAFADPEDYDAIKQGDAVEISFTGFGAGEPLAAEVKIGGRSVKTSLALSPREKHLVLSGGLLASLK